MKHLFDNPTWRFLKAFLFHCPQPARGLLSPAFPNRQIFFSDYFGTGSGCLTIRLFYLFSYLDTRTPATLPPPRASRRFPPSRQRTTPSCQRATPSCQRSTPSCATTTPGKGGRVSWWQGKDEDPVSVNVAVNVNGIFVDRRSHGLPRASRGRR